MDNLSDLGTLFERWLTTRDPYTGQRLMEMGMLPTSPIDD